VNSVEIAAFTTACGSIGAATVGAVAAIRAARHSAAVKREVATPANEPSINVIIPELFHETLRQSTELAEIKDQLNTHLREHGQAHGPTFSTRQLPSSADWRSDH
jgi:glutamate/tyrosine decarboxylase-like PLP-dependent enzyme